MSEILFQQIANRLSKPIPKPKTKPPKSAKSWKTLKPGQILSAKSEMFLAGQRIQIGSLWTVSEVDSTSCLLISNTESGRIKWTLGDWQKHWTKKAKRK